MQTAPAHPLSPGDRAPNFVLPDNSGAYTMFYERVQGGRIALVFDSAFPAGDLAAGTAALDAAAGRFAAAGVEVFCVTLTEPDSIKGIATPHHLWSDPKRKIAEGFLAQLGLGGLSALEGGQTAAALLDANQRLLEVVVSAREDLPDKILEAFAKRPECDSQPQVRAATAPVLTIPKLLDDDMCRELMAMFDAGEIEEGGVFSTLDGEEQARVHHDRKKRLDLKIMDPEVNRVLQQTIGRRIAPELAKAFSFEGFRFDRFLVCRYAADRQDRFRTHRDNLSPSTADRRFAMTLNLNGDSYKGGELVFPEYGPHRYKPGDGGAVIFSCSLLHEALPVTEGVRYALLTFLRAPAATK